MRCFIALSQQNIAFGQKSKNRLFKKLSKKPCQKSKKSQKTQKFVKNIAKFCQKLQKNFLKKVGKKGCFDPKKYY